MKQWYYAKNGEQKGPVMENDLIALLQNSEIPPDSLIWSEGMPEWTSAKDVELSRTPPTEELHSTENAVQDVENISITEDEARRGIGRGAYFGWTVLIIIMSKLSAEFSLILIIPALFVGGMRYRNIGYSPWVILLGLIPLVNLVVGYQCLAFPSGYAQTKQPDLIMNKVSWLYGILIGFAILGIILAIVIPLLAG